VAGAVGNFVAEVSEKNNSTAVSFELEENLVQTD
jgi:hypothetical protein